MIRLEAKDPDAVLRYGWDVSAELADGVTVSTTEIVDTTGGITVGTLSETDGVVSGLVSDGTLGENATATLRYTTSDGQTDDLTIMIPIRQQ